MGVVAAAMVAGAGVMMAARAVDTPSPTPANVVLTTEDFVFSDRKVEMAGGMVELTMTNADAVPHTFTVADLGVDLVVAGGEARSVTFAVAPGRYTFVCTVPGHDGPGMQGELVVR